MHYPQLVLEKVIRIMNILPDKWMKLDGTSISILAYADDIVLLGNNINTMKSLCERLIRAARRVGLQINEEKTEYTEISRQRYGRQVDFLEVGPYSFKNVSQFIYLGTMITQSNNMEYDILEGIQMGNKCYYTMVKEIKRRLEWAGHEWRKPDAMTKMVLQENPRGKRPLGRPRRRWEDCVKKDVAVFFPEENWHMLAQNREGWRHLCLDVWSKRP
ncbi:hypothetical protein QTP88_004125 [Uroleucon formosanum]